VLPAALNTLPKGTLLATQVTLLIHPEQNPTDYVPFEHADTHPFQPAVTGMSRVNAWWLADASWLAYLHSEAEVRRHAQGAGLDGRLVEVKETQFCMVSDQEFAIVAFRGTQPNDWKDIFDDARYVPVGWPHGHVHNGFAAALNEAWSALEDSLRRLPHGARVWFTGHSLGAALATLAADRFTGTAGVYTFGSPRVGDQMFAGHFNARFNQRSFRYVNDHDVVTHVPPEPLALPLGLYTHVNDRRWIDKDGNIGSIPPTLLHFVPDVLGSPVVMLDLIESLKSGNLRTLPAALSDHTQLYYTLHAWNDFVKNG